MNNYYWPYVANLWAYAIGNDRLESSVHNYIKNCRPASPETTTQCIYYSLCGSLIQESVRENTTVTGNVFHITLMNDRRVKTFVGIMSNNEISYSYFDGMNIVNNIVNCATLQEFMYFLVMNMVININYQIISVSTSAFNPVDVIFILCCKFNKIEDYHETTKMVQ